MAIVKNEYPILEFDTEEKAIVMPNRKKLFKFPEKCVFGFYEYIQEYALKNKSEVIGQFDAASITFPIYQMLHKSENICFCAAPLGASASVSMLDFLIAYGVKKIVASGCCGALVDLPEGTIMIPTIALRDEGTSYHYLPPSRNIAINLKAITAIQKASAALKVPYLECKTWTTDGFYRETKEMVAYRIAEGFKVVEMECSALAACAEFRNACFGQILFTADTLANPEKHEDRGWGQNAWETAFMLSLESVWHI